MFDPFSLAAGGVLVGIGYVSGRIGRRKNKKNPTPSKPLKAICGCSHGYHNHDPKTGVCTALVLHKDWYDERGRYRGNQRLACTCKQYNGPKPLEQYFATMTLPPADM
jgi:hypothetical protein